MAPFILFEGIEGSGKTTQARRLAGRLRRRGVPVVLVREPGSTVVGNATRRLLKHRLDVHPAPLTEVFLFAAARAQLVSEVIRPALESGRTVICDRYGESTLAYQGYGRGIAPDLIRTINGIATNQLRPDLIVLLDLKAEAGLRRKGASVDADRFEREDLDFHRRVRQGYLEMARQEPERWLVIDAALPPRQISDLVWNRVLARLPRSATLPQP